MRQFDFKREDFAQLARMDGVSILAAHQSARVVVLGMEVPGTALTTLFSIPPKGRYFGQDWWLGQAYSNWFLTAGFDETLVDMVLRGLKQSRLSIKQLPVNFLNLNGGIARERGAKSLILDTRLVQSITIPSDTVDELLRAFDASHELLHDYLFVAHGNDYRPETGRHGEVLLERAFSIGFPGKDFLHGTAYRNPMMQALGNASRLIPKPGPAEQKTLLEATIADLDELDLQSKRDRNGILSGAFRLQYFYMLDAREFAPSLAPLVAAVNTRRSRLVKALNCPHFFSSMAIRSLDVATNKLQNKYRYLPNDRDWLLRLQKISPESFSSGFDELRDVDGYVAAMKEQYACLAEDMLQKVMPRCPVHTFKF